MSNLVPALNGTLINHDDCTLSTCSMDYAEMSYVPTLAGNMTYIVLLGIILISQIALGAIYRTWGFLIGMICGLVLELLGYVGRVQLHYNPFVFNSFLLYLVCLTLGPAFLSASLYLCLGRIIMTYGQDLSRFKPRTYAILFMSCDFISLLLQAIGGAIAATADETEVSEQKMGVHIMVAGLAWQVVSLALYMLMWGEFALRAHRASESQKSSRFADLRRSFAFKAFQYSLFAATVFIFIRSIFRVAELQSGFNGAIANSQTAFMVLEGPMIIAATGLLTVFHPGVSFAGNWRAATWSLRNKGYKNVEKGNALSTETIEV